MLNQRRKVRRARGSTVELLPVLVEGLSWNELRSYAADRGVLKPGMTKKQVLAALKV